MNLEDHIKNYERFLAANETALQQIAAMTSSQQISPQEIEALFRPIIDMEACLLGMNTMPSSLFYEGQKRDDYFNHLDKRMRQIKMRTEYRLRFAVKRERTALSPAIREELLHDSQRWVAQLQSKLEGEFAAGAVTVDELQTPHDLVRYMHRVGTELFYDPNGYQWNMPSSGKFVCKKGGFDLRLLCIGVPAEEYFKTNPFLQRLHEIMESNKFKSKWRDTDTIRALGGEGIVSFQLPLGCHYATLQMKEEKDHYRMAFKFTDTLNYDTSKFRSDITEKLLQSLGYTVTRNKNIMWINERFDSLDAAVNNFEEIIRLSVSLLNVDVMDKSNVVLRESDVIAAYHAGVINLGRYINAWKRGSYVEYAKACHSYRGPDVIAQLEKPIPVAVQEEIKRKPLEYLVAIMKNSYAAVKQFERDTNPGGTIEERIWGAVGSAVIGAVVGLLITSIYVIAEKGNEVQATEGIPAAQYAPLPICPMENILDIPVKVSKK